ncbi:sensor histidine kinase [Chitinophaga qingshengii]|uniref:histidine kinase n=1 Tax=Chitinophaga qingshengii TaxID=1569794 RepID=A0ABR7THD7_9BACT|nr:HAMP domain-containing sensor histidine kinase [Chitinophaga qingshengii]MBC9929854.1 HAMP domain-containing histidine kinase [Chitinophaga qingshengii]
MFFRKIANYWNAIVNTGIHPGLSFIETRRTRLLNIVCIPGVILTLYFCILNLAQHRPWLALVNFIHTSCDVLVLYLNKKQRYLQARAAVIIMSLLLYGISGFFFRNGVEFYLILILVLIYLIYDNKWLLGILSVLIISVIAFVYYAPVIWDLAPMVPSGRILANLVIALGMVVIALIYFKSVHTEFQQQTEDQRKSLDVLNQDKMKLLSVIAHDIRSPLATLEGLLLMFNNGHYSETEMKAAGVELHLKVSQLGETLSNLLRWTAGQMKGIHSEPEDVSLALLIKDALNTYEPRIYQKALKLDIQVDDHLLVYADPHQLGIVIRNLVSNAIKFSYREGLITIRAAIEDEKILLDIIDQGVGISAEKRETLFSFNGQPAYGTAGERGSGIGLVLCAEFVRLNNGEIEVESEPGKGATFRLVFSGDPEDAGWAG